MFGQTAAEIIRRRADHSQPNMASTTWKARSEGRRGRGQELSERAGFQLNRIVTMWLDFAEDQATRRKEVFLKDWAES